MNLRFLFEAEEEIGSTSLPGVVRERAEALSCDVVLSADGGMWRADVPSLTLSARGMLALELTVRSAGKDLHSGRHGGGIQNPLHALAELIASLHANGRVAVEGFYDDVIPPSAEQLEALERLAYDDEAYLADVGAPATFGEPGFGTLARQWLRPTLGQRDRRRVSGPGQQDGDSRGCVREDHVPAGSRSGSGCGPAVRA